MEVVAIEAPPEADELRLYGAILDAIGAPVPAGGAMEGRASRPRPAATSAARRLLIIDETNNLVIGSGAAQRRTLAALRRLSNMPVALDGLFLPARWRR